jgi:hypothetical protein
MSDVSGPPPLTEPPSIERFPTFNETPSASEAEIVITETTNIASAENTINESFNQLRELEGGNEVVKWFGGFYQKNTVENGENAPEIIKNVAAIANRALEMPVVGQTFTPILDAGIRIMNNITGYTEENQPGREVIIAGVIYQQFKWIEPVFMGLRDVADHVKNGASGNQLQLSPQTA